MSKIDVSLIGSTVTFSTHAGSVLSDEYSNVKITGFGSYAMATGFISPAELHAIVYPSLPEGTPNDYRAYQYVILEQPGGRTTAVGLPWIDEDSLVINGNIEINVVVRDKSVDDIERLRKVLVSNNFMNISISITPLVVE